MKQYTKEYRSLLRRLRKVRAQFLSDARSCSMRHWRLAWRPELSLRKPECETVGCIAGWFKEFSDDDQLSPAMTLHVAVREAGFGLDLSSLMYETLWPEPLRSELSETEPQTKRYAKLVVKRIDLFIEELRSLRSQTGGRA